MDSLANPMSATKTLNDHPKVRLDPRPLYMQAEEALAELLAQSEPGEQLPAEPELARILGISRATLREAIRSFEQRGLIDRRPGVGTFVLPPRPIIESGLEELESIDTLARRQGLETQIAGLEIGERPATPHEAGVLHIDAGAPVFCVIRDVLAGHEPIAYLQDVLPAGLVERDAFDVFHGSVLDMLLARGEPVLTHSRTDLTAQTARAVLAQRLRLERGTPLLLLRAVLFNRDGVPVDYSHSYFVPGYFKFHVVRRVGQA